MQTKAELLQLIEQYTLRFPDETERIQPFISFVNAFDGTAMYSRKNFIGHLTASAFIINPQSDSLLLLHHKSLNKWLQPGGHVDEEDSSLVTAALREVEEETGLSSNDVNLVYDLIFDIDSHPIPANARKMEPAHVHHDVRFLFKCSPNNLFKLNKEEATGLEWVKFSALNNYRQIFDVLRKINTFT